MPKQPIVVGYDGTDAARTALSWALDEAVHRDAPVEVVCVVWCSRIRPTASTTHPDDAAAADALVTRARAVAARTHPQVPVAAQVAIGPPAKVLREMAKRAQMVVVGSEPHGRLTGLWDDSVSVTLATEVRCPVVIVRQTGGDAGAKPVVVGLDGEASLAALRFALTVAADRGVDLVAVHAWRPYTPSVFADISLRGEQIAEVETAEHRQMSRRIQQVTRQFPAVPVRLRLVADDVVHALISAGEQAQLLVVGTETQGRLSGVLGGAVGVRLLRRTGTPVAIVHARVNERAGTGQPMPATVAP